MKIILAPTDFSKAAGNAVNYAAEIAIRTKAMLVLLHASHPPVIISEVPVVIPTDEEMQNDSVKWLKKIRYNLVAKHGSRLEIDMICVRGTAPEAIDQYANDNLVDLIVMGTEGAGYLEEKLIGSVTSDLIKKTMTPVLSVAPRARFKGIKKIILATDVPGMNSSHVLNPLKKMARLFHSHIYVLTITQKGTDLPELSQVVEEAKLNRVFEEVDHSFHTASSKDTVTGINAFAEEKMADIVVMMPRRHTIFETLIKKRNTKAMLFHSNIPLLTIHD